MRLPGIALAIMLFSLIAYPALAVQDEHYSYVTVRAMNITLDRGHALVHVDYQIDEGTHFIVLLLGKQDLKSKILKMVNYEDATIKNIEMDHADLIVDHITYDYGKGIYWFPEHQFNVRIPVLTVISPQVRRVYSNTTVFPEGIGYFDS